MSGAVLLYCAGKAVAVMQHHDAITYVLDGHSLRPTDPSLFLSLSSHCTCICKQLQLTPSLPWCHLKTTHKSAKFKPLSLFLFLYFLGGQSYVKGSPSKSVELEIDVIGPENILFACRRVRASFSPEILQAAAVKGLR